MIRLPPRPTRNDPLATSTTPFRSGRENGRASDFRRQGPRCADFRAGFGWHLSDARERQAHRLRAAQGAREQAGGSRLAVAVGAPARSEEHTSELQSLMRISYAVFCLKKKNKKQI